MAPGPTPATGGLGAKLPAICCSLTMSACSGPAHTAATRRPPGFNTRAISRAAAVRSTTYIRLSEARTASWLDPSAGIASARPSAKETLVSAAVDARVGPAPASRG